MYEWLKSSKGLVKSIIGTIGVKGLSMIIGLFTTAAYMHYFSSNEILGVWLALVSILNWIINFDLGIGNGLRNKLVIALNEGNKKQVKCYISSAYVILGVISLIILIIGNCFLEFIDWNSLLNVSTLIFDKDMLLLVVRITFSGIILQFFLRLIISILYALQKPAIANLITLISNSLILVFASLFRLESIEKSMVILSIMQAVTVNLPLLIATIWVFASWLKEEKPNLHYYISDMAKNILSLGYQFFWIQLALLVINSTNDFLIAHLFGPNYVVEYQIYDKIFILLSSGFSLITVPIWSAITKASVEQKKDWIRKTYHVLLILAGLVCIVAIILPLIYQSIVNIWLGTKTISISIMNAYIFAFYNSILVFNYASASVANGLGILNVQIKCNTAAAILKIPLVFLISYFINNWICVILVNILIMLPCTIMQPIAIRKHMNAN